MKKIESTRGRLFRLGGIVAGLAAVAGLAVAGAAAASTRSPVASHGASGPRPTIVLVHGAWAGPSSWESVVHRLRDDGFRTVTPTLGLTSLPGDVATVDAVLNQTHGKKVLVGHSYGGAVISGASSGRSDVSALVYSAAFAQMEVTRCSASGRVSTLQASLLTSSGRALRSHLDRWQ